MPVEVFVQNGHAYREALCPQYAVGIGDDELHAAAADVHDKHALFGGRHRKDHALIDELRFPFSADEPYFDAGAFLNFPNKNRAIAGGAQGGGAEYPHLFYGDVMGGQHPTEALNGLHSAPVGLRADRFDAFFRQFNKTAFPKDFLDLARWAFLSNEQMEGIGAQVDDCVAVHLWSISW